MIKMSKRAWSVLGVLLAATTLDHVYANASADCGGTLQKEPCEAKDCTWQASSSVGPQCTAAEDPDVTCSAVGTRLDCGYFGVQQPECVAKGCCWAPTGAAAQNDIPWCFFHNSESGAYSIKAVSKSGCGYVYDLQSSKSVLQELGTDFPCLKVLVEQQTAARLHIKIAPAGVKRWEVPESLLPRPVAPAEAPDGLQLRFVAPQKVGDTFSFAVVREEGSGASQSPDHAAVLFNTSGFSLVFKDQYIELTTAIPADAALYGLGERTLRSGLQLPRDGRVITLWNADVGAGNVDINLYGSHAFYMDLRPDGSAHGVYLLNSNGMDISLNPDSLTFRVIGGVLDFYMFAGPTPQDVLRQYHDVIGRPAMPPRWALGFQQSRWGYKSVDELQQVVDAYKQADLPLEVIWSDIDYADHYRMFTLDPVNYAVPKMRAFVEGLHAAGQRWVPIMDCGVFVQRGFEPYEDGAAVGAFILDRTGQPYLGEVWSGPTHWPDFLGNTSWEYWRKHLAALHDLVPYDGLWTDMNEVSNFQTGDVCRLTSITSPAVAPTAAALAAASASGSAHALRRGHPARRSATGRPAARRTASVTDAKLTAPPADLEALRMDTARGGGSDSTQRQQQQQQQQQQQAGATQEAPHVVVPAESRAVGSPAAANSGISCSPPGEDDLLSFPPYRINNMRSRAPLGTHTVAPTALMAGGTATAYDAHTIYPLAQSAATHAALVNITGKRPFILTRSTFPGTGKYAAHWTGDNQANWDNLRYSITGVLNSNLWGIPLAGSDICGFMGGFDEELCVRWLSAGAMYPFMRVHSDINSPPREAYRTPATRDAARKALTIRQRLQPYMYTTFHTAHTEGGAVAQPVFFVAPTDVAARAAGEQWMIGEDILVAPVLQESAVSVMVTFPTGHEWASLAGDHERVEGGQQLEVAAHLGDLPIYVRGGSVVPLQRPGANTAAVAASPLTLLVVLAPSAGTQRSRGGGGAHVHNGGDGAARGDEQYEQRASGRLYHDEGEELEVGGAAALQLAFTAGGNSGSGAACSSGGAVWGHRGWLRSEVLAAPAAGSSGAGLYVEHVTVSLPASVGGVAQSVVSSTTGGSRGLTLRSGGGGGGKGLHVRGGTGDAGEHGCTVTVGSRTLSSAMVRVGAERGVLQVSGLKLAVGRPFELMWACGCV